MQRSHPNVPVVPAIRTVTGPVALSSPGDHDPERHVTRRRIPDDILSAAHARAAARAAGDWDEADRLRAEIEAAGWKIADRGTDFALTPAAPPDVAEGERIRYGSSASVPARWDEPATGLATVVLIATDWADDLARTLAGSARNGSGRDVGRDRRRRAVRRAGRGPGGLEETDADGARRAADRDRLDERAARPRCRHQHRPPACRRPGRRPARHERRTDRRRRHAAGAGARRPDASPSPVAGGSSRPTCASSRTRRRATSTPSRAICRRSVGRMPPRADRSTNGSASIGTSTSGGASSCATRGRTRRRAAPSASMGCPLVRHEHRGYTSLPDEERDRQSKRNFYRIIDRFGWRRDLLTTVADRSRSAGARRRPFVLVLPDRLERITRTERDAGDDRPHQGRDAARQQRDPDPIRIAEP